MGGRKRARSLALVTGALVCSCGLPAVTLAGNPGLPPLAPCGPPTVTYGGARALHGAPPQAWLSRFAILRGTPSAADASGLQAARSLADNVMRGFWRSVARQVTEGGTNWELMPGLPEAPPPISAQCLSEKQRARLPELRARQRRISKEPVICLIPPAQSGVVLTITCPRLGQVLGGQTLIDVGESTTPVPELAPDGVASVKVVFGIGSVTSMVTDNVYTVVRAQGPILAAKQRAAMLLAKLTSSPRKSPAAEKRIEHELLRVDNRLAGLVRPIEVDWLNASGVVIRAQKIHGQPPTATQVFM
jgi:hypothetical protein